MRPVTSDDFVVIDRWLSLWDHPPIHPDLYPPTGLIEDGFGAGWILCTDSKLCLMENFVTNREVDRTQRRDACIRIAVALEKIAKERGYKFMGAYTAVSSVKEAVEQIGYKLANMSWLLGRELT